MNLIETYDPSNAKNLTDEEKQKMQNLSKEEIAQLAEAYPNASTGAAYLYLKDKRVSDDKQVYSLSSWQNLNDLYRYGQTWFEPFGFKAVTNIRKTPLSTSAAIASQPLNFPKKETVDLSKSQAENAAGLKPAGTEKQPENTGTSTTPEPTGTTEQTDVNTQPEDNTEGGTTTTDTIPATNPADATKRGPGRPPKSATDTQTDNAETK